MSNLISRIFTALVLLFMASAAFAGADQDAISQAHAFAKHLHPPLTDYSVAYLGQIFGTVGNVLAGTSGEVLGTMFKIFNEGVLVVAVMWLGYTTVTIALRASHEGSFMGQNRNIGVVFLRVAIGFGLLLPSSATGYSLLQVIFMKIVVQGVGLADQTWDAALNYLKHGGSLYIPPATISTDQDILAAAIGTSAAQGQLASAAQIFQNEVCMEKSEQWKQHELSQTGQNTSSGSSIISSAAENYVSPYRPIFDENAGMVYFPGATDPSNTTTGSSCGTATSYYVSSGQANASGGWSSGQQAAFKAYSFSALKQMTLSLIPAVTEYVSEQNQNATTPSQGLSTTVTRQVFTALLAYVNLMTPYQSLLSQGSQANSADAFIQAAKAQGWIMAGGFFWDVEQTNKHAQAQSVSSLLPTTVTPPTIYNKHKTDLDNAATAITATPTMTQLNSDWAEYVGAEQNTVTSSSGSTGGGLLGHIASSGLSNLAQAWYDTGNDSSQFHEYNPISVLMGMGGRLLTAVVSMWIAAISLSTIGAIAAGWCSGKFPAAGVFNAIMSWVKSIIMLISSAILVPGAILAYYVPLYPFFVFTFAAVGWFLLVVEGMAAAPLVCVGITHPEGHDFLGKGEQALMLFLSIFLRPTLMIIGLIASMVVSFVAFHMLLSGFATVMHSLSGSTTFKDSGLLVLVNQVVVLVIFGFITMTLIEQCYGLIFKLPNYIMAWIGGPTTGEDYGQMAKSAQGAIGGAAKPMGDTIGAVGDLGGIAKAKAEQKPKGGNDSGGSLTPGGGASGGGAPST
ncbi:MAG: hypothetical protein A3B71_00500 [Gammaproteobacteria bacterium RIFCSPHIGHO2_02_FULL_42_43]|nr:MAG: hypothetical protein A3B71_00500 [Gammaproteobacteria bacterium RIFCSPHIGHO2_02_FULL_42_43]